MKDWESLRRDCERCRQCSLGETRTNLVFGDGSTSAKLMLVGEGPGQQEDLTGVPFVGPAGQLLDQMMAIIDLDRTKYYITNIVKCRPPRNRDPLATEQEACIGYLREQTRLLRPQVIVCLGRIAAMRLIRPDYRITREHGQWVQRGGVWMTAIYHPSALLRDESKRPETFDDLMSIRDKLAELFPEGL
ncbi:MAG: uracil-DNA glycosylase [Clostridiales bacterium]|nr:uracil-DNA glycosylase [Clostridiales bacterium]